MFAADGVPRPGVSFLVQRINALPGGELHHRQRAAGQARLHLGITFNVYGDNAGIERVFHCDIIPRIVEAADGEYIERGLKQRIAALNLFIDDDGYPEQKIVKDLASRTPGAIVRAADTTSRILDIKYFILLLAVTDVGTPFDDIQWAAVLGLSPA